MIIYLDTADNELCEVDFLIILAMLNERVMHRISAIIGGDNAGRGAARACEPRLASAPPKQSTAVFRVVRFVSTGLVDFC